MFHLARMIKKIVMKRKSREDWSIMKRRAATSWVTFGGTTRSGITVSLRPGGPSTGLRSNVIA